MSEREKKIPIYAKFAVAGLGGMLSAYIFHPLDFMKTRMQMSGQQGKEKLYKSTLDGVIKIFKSEGILTFYTGATATLLRQATYTTARMGIYTSLFEIFSKGDEPPSFAVKTAIGMFGGMCGGFVGTPADLCLIRMVSDQLKPPSNRYHYSNVFHALYRITKDEGVTRLWKGGLPTTVRAVAVNGSVLATYSQFKELLLATKYFKDDLVLYFSASMLSGFISAIITLPIDIVKTRLQSAKTVGGEKQTIWKVFIGILRDEGFFAYWKGFTPYFSRFAPVTVCTFVFVEQLSYWYQIYVLGNKNVKKTF